MSTDPERPIEKALRTCARDRHERAGEAWDLHAANRRLLQQEVAQRFGQAAERSQTPLARLLGQWWLRGIAGIGGLAAVAALIATVWLGDSRSISKRGEPLLAKNEGIESGSVRLAANEKPVDRELDSMKQLVQSKELLADNPARAKDEEALSRRDVSAVKTLSPASSPIAKREPAAPPAEQAINQPLSTAIAESGSMASAPVAIAQAPGLTQRYGLSRGPQPEPGTLAASAPLSDTVANQVKTSGAASSLPQPGVVPAITVPSTSPSAAVDSAAPVTLNNTSSNELVDYGYFVGNAMAGRQSRSFQEASPRQAGVDRKAVVGGEIQSPLPILGYFRVEQLGQELRVIDSDNSVYTGQIQPSTLGIPEASGDKSSAKLAEIARTNRQIPASNSGLQRNESASVPFQVLGTNRSSNQRVIFAGTLTGITNLADWRRQNQTQNRPRDQTVSPASRESQSNVSLQNVGVTGKAMIGGQELEVIATPAPAQQMPR